MWTDILHLHCAFLLPAGNADNARMITVRHKEFAAPATRYSHRTCQLDLQVMFTND